MPWLQNGEILEGGWVDEAWKKWATEHEVYKNGYVSSTVNSNFNKFKEEFNLKFVFAGDLLPKKKKVPEPEENDVDMAKYEYEIKTQKTKGLAVLKKLSANNYSTMPRVPAIYAVVDVATGVIYGTEKYPCFARPCPKTPRHGFVDSRTVNDKAELNALIVETKKADPDGEVLLMPFLAPQFNTIWTPAFMAVGKGHDGATAGSGSIKFPLNGICDEVISKALEEAGVTEYPYIEAVSVGTETYATQLRNGPKLDTKPDYIPKETVVSEVILPESVKGDLLAWEDLMKAKTGVDGVVVYHPGGSQADHFSIHARCCEIACITSFKPTIGQVVKKIETAEPDYKAVLRGMVAGDTYKFLKTELKKKSAQNANGATFKNEATLMLMGLHNSSAMEGETAYWLGVALTFMFRLGSMALRGEARHVDPGVKISRSQVYGRAANMKIQAHAKSCRNLIGIFRYGWKPGGGGIGGTKWAQCGISLGLLFNAVREFILEQDKNTFNKVLATFNDVVNQAHNNGWWLNKFVSKDVFDKAQKGDLKMALSVSPMIHEIGEIYKNLDPAKVAKTIEMWGRWDPVDQKPPKTVRVQVEDMTTLNQNTLKIRVIDRVLGELRKPFVVALGDVGKKIPYGVPKELYLREGPSGMCIDLAIPGLLDEPIPVWEETPLQIQKGKNV